MKLLTRAFADWCHIPQIPLDKVSLVVRATDDLVRNRIESAAAGDLQPLYPDVLEPPPTSTHHLTLNGVRVSFSTLDRSRQ